MSAKEKRQEIRKRRDDAIAEADRVYRWALEAATEKMQEARRVFIKATFDAQERWRAELAAIDGGKQPSTPEARK